MKSYLPILIVLFSYSVVMGQNENFINQQLENRTDSIVFIQIETDSIFNSNQVISLLIIPNNVDDSYSVDFIYRQTELKTTSSLAKGENAIAAINGGFFNRDSGGGVTYFEMNNAVINRKRDPKLKWGIVDSLMNGAIIIANDQDISIQSVISEQIYESSKQESAVLVTGPLLLLNSESVKLANMGFVNKRHPRTCLCINQESVALITIDGRTNRAEGMNLIEAQDFLKTIGCTDAINLDGGGSTTMWTKKRGIVNLPSDKSGERLVSNALVIMKK